MFKLSRCAETGNLDWVVEEDADDSLGEEIALSTYGDMLHDEERNEKYHTAIQNAVSSLKKAGQKVHCVDIGTGTGLLSVFALKAGADRVSAFESFTPMCRIAEQVFRDNSIDVTKINLINQSSRDYKGRDLNVEKPINLIVAEIFDTELIGEGCLSTFIHASTHLAQCSISPIMVPWGATVYAVPIQSGFIESFMDIRSGVSEFAPEYEELSKCRGLGSPFEIQFSCLENFEQDFVQICDPVSMFHFNFAQLGKESLQEVVERKFVSKYTGCVRAVLMFWSLHLDHEEPSLDISNAPKLIKNTSLDIQYAQQWREHWVQAVYPVKGLEISAGESYLLRGFHDEYTFWFEIDVVDSTGESDVKNLAKNEPPSCSCGVHVGLNRNRVCLLNSQFYAQKVKKVLSSIPDLAQKSVLITGNFNLTLSKIILEMNVSKIICEESNSMCIRTLQKLLKACNLSDKIRLVTSVNEDVKIDVVIGEPFYMSSLLPWHHAFMFLEACRKMRESRQVAFDTVPSRGCLKCALVKTAHLHRLRAPVSNVRGVNLDAFNKVVVPLTNKCFTNLESHYLFQYETYFVSKPMNLMEFDFCDTETSDGVNHLKRDILFGRDFVCDATGKIEDSNAVVFWMEYKLCDHAPGSNRGCDDECFLSEGPIREDASKAEQSVGHKSVKLSPGHKQAVMFINPGLHRGFNVKIDRFNSEVTLLEF